MGLDREGRPFAWTLLGATILALYDGYFIALSLASGTAVDGFRSDHYDLVGTLICVAGVAVMGVPSRS